MNATWVMQWDEPAENLKFDMNIVESKFPNSRFYYDQYRITALCAGCTLPPTPSPTPEAPTQEDFVPAPTPDSGAASPSMIVVSLLGALGAVSAWWTM